MTTGQAQQHNPAAGGNPNVRADAGGWISGPGSDLPSLGSDLPGPGSDLPGPGEAPADEPDTMSSAQSCGSHPGPQRQALPR